MMTQRVFIPEGRRADDVAYEIVGPGFNGHYAVEYRRGNLTPAEMVEFGKWLQGIGQELKEEKHDS